jgi:Tfp pilus assembly pilus retraction ATPase PilT
MQTMDAALAALVRDGRITRDLALSRAGSESELQRLLGGSAAVAGGPSLVAAQ